MRQAPRLLLALAALVLAPLSMAPAALAQDRVAVRVGTHPGHGRIVFDWPAPPTYTLDEIEDGVVLRFPDGAALDLSGARRVPRNVVAITSEPDGVSIKSRPGARVRVLRVGPKLVVDVLDPVPSARQATPQPVDVPAAAEAPPAAATPAPAPPDRAALQDAQPPAPTAPPDAPIIGMSAPPMPAAVVLPRPSALAVRVLAQPGRDRAILLPYPAATGAAVLRRGGLLLALFDTAEPLDLSALRNDPVFGGLEADTLGGATLLRLPLAPPAILRARREAAGWILEASRPNEARAATTRATERAMVLEAEGGAAARLLIRANLPGRVVPVTDPESGMPLLLGTLREAGQNMPVARRLPELDLLPTLLGAAVLARADQVTLRAGPDRFLVGAEGGRLALDVAAAQAAPNDAMTRSFDLPQMPPARLLERLRALSASIADAPPLTRWPLRRAAGEALLALGLPHEAQAMLGLAPGEDPQAVADPRFPALSGAAALLAGRLPQAMALNTASLPETDELTLWRAALAAALGDARAAAPGLAATLPLLFDYPEALRSRLLPPAAHAIAEAAAWPALKQLLERAGPLPELALPRAMLAEAEGEADAALAGYDEVARGRDRLARARALRRAVELRLATGRLDAGQAARALDAAIVAWRGDSEEADTRLRVAELRRSAGDARGALALLRETEAFFPEKAPQLGQAIGTSFLAALEQEAPLAAVALFDANPALLPADQRGEAAMLMLADRLVALDLADRAAGLLGQAAERVRGAPRAALGLRQAALRFADGDALAAQAALEATAVAEPLPEDLANARSILAARARARLGHQADAIAALQGMGPAGAEALAQMLVDQQDWSGATTVFARHLRAALPAMPAPLDDTHRRLLLRQAAMLVLAGDEPGLAALRGEHAERLRDGPLAEAFTMLTAGQLRGLADLPRLQRELQLFRSMPTRLEALRAGGPVTR